MSEDTRIQEALRRYGFQTTTATVGEQQIRLTLRVPPNVAEQWKVCMFALLDYAERATWTIDPSRKYFLRGEPPHKKMFYIWRLIFQGPAIRDSIPEIVRVICSIPKAKHEVKEIALPGGRVQSVRGKGASSITGDAGVPAVAQLGMARLRGG